MHFARVNRGAALRKIGRIEEALADLRMAVTAAPNDAETQYQYANALRQAGVMAEADSAFRRALAIAPLRSDIHRDFARMLWEEGVGAQFLEPLDAVLALGLPVLLWVLPRPGPAGAPGRPQRPTDLIG